MTDKQNHKEQLLGYAVNASSVDLFNADLAASISAQNGLATCRCHWLACLNPHSYVVARKDAHFSTALKAADWLIPDGIGTVLASRMLRGQIRERVTGSDVFRGLLSLLNASGGVKVFFLGSSEATLALIRARMARDYPNIEVVGTYSPPFKSEFTSDEIDEMIAAVNDAGTDILWVGMTAPKQERWIYNHRDRLNVKFAGAVGAVFDFYAGKVNRSHPVFQRAGLEWLPRLLQEPRRLWRRTFVSGPVFLFDVLKAKVHGRC